jgi:hypothetical protein
MSRRPILDPRFYRLDDLLRRPLSSDTPFGSGGGELAVEAASGWGFDGAATFRGVVIPSPLSLSIWVEGSPVFPEDGVYRPSHVTVNARETETGLQISEDKFVSHNNVLVSVLSLRNPGEWSVETNMRVQWGIQRGEHADSEGNLFWASRFAPNVQDRRFTLASGGRTRLVFTLALATDDRYAQSPATPRVGVPNRTRTTHPPSSPTPTRSRRGRTSTCPGSTAPTRGFCGRGITRVTCAGNTPGVPPSRSRTRRERSPRSANWLGTVSRTETTTCRATHPRRFCPTFSCGRFWDGERTIPA